VRQAKTANGLHFFGGRGQHHAGGNIGRIPGVFFQEAGAINGALAVGLNHRPVLGYEVRTYNIVQSSVHFPGYAGRYYLFSFTHVVLLLSVPSQRALISTSLVAVGMHDYYCI
jgi:hypothetical protein